LVEAIAAEVTKHGGNWEQSSMARLAGKFAGVLCVAIDAEQAESLTRALGQLERQGLRVLVEDVQSAAAGIAGRRARLALVGNDHEGIVRDLSHALVAQGVNVEELDTQCEAAPVGGGSLFRANAVLMLPSELAIDTLQAALEALADDLMVEIHLDAGDSD
jgi:glycine cleavage system regulatory protein